MEILTMLRSLLIADLIVTGIVYGIGPRGEHQGPTYFYLTQVPGGMRAIGCAFLVVGVTLLGARHRPRVQIYAHMTAVALYLMYGAGLGLSYLHSGDPGAGPVHFAALAALNGAFAVETARRKAA